MFKIYILDFGIARKFVKGNDGELKTPREGIGFKGTVRFASLSCHSGTEVGRVDDVESWFYLLLDIMLVKGLPWKKITEKKMVAESKKKLRTNICEEYSEIKFKEELKKIMDYINNTKYYEDVDYKYIYEMLKMAGKVSGLDIDSPFDWEKEKSKMMQSSALTDK